MDSIVAQVHSLAKNADEAARRSIQTALEDLLFEIQDPKYIVYQLLNSPVKLTVVRVSIDINLFKTLANSESPRTVSSLAEQLKVDEDLLGRILRYLASNNLIKQTGVEEFAANQVTQIFTGKGAEAVTSQAFNVVGPVLQVVPPFLAETNYQSISVKTKTPLQKAFNTELSAFEWLAQNPEHMQNAQLAMVSNQASNWARNFKLLDDAVHEFMECSQPSSDRPFLVDVGGGYGHQTGHLKDKHPCLSGHLVLQDMPQVVAQVSGLEGVKVMAQDFFTPQAVQGAPFYYFRRILHDYPDDQCVKILQNIIPVMASDSRILIDETVLPDTNVSWQAVMADLYMMFMMAGKERSEKQWRALADSAGLRVVYIHVHDLSSHSAVLVLERK
ncbi:putative O-methyltransferase [Aspergillus steynii IBT 23096]|uniref:Putative O-methyltransferase n=1 Tax=Aspergillus steynii IBT 23096 TaxID=1392250 RepID=A0A2I2G6M1_9EURO|nr:putative O-methyltransferase [Aspergillus steynii IBT 23096]PLB48528.1 putative O-methyltransferase [Aspergillus steynii IBT 23096]